MMIEKSKRRQGILILGILFAAVILLFMPGRADALTPEDAAVAVSKGWHTLPSGGYTYMISNSTHATGFLRIKNKWYHFDDEGYLSLRWFVVNGKKYFAYPGSKVGRKKGVLRSGYAKAEESIIISVRKTRQANTVLLRPDGSHTKENISIIRRKAPS